MCYTVLVVEEVCHKEHIQKVTPAWRQCRRMAEISKQAKRWDILCEDREDPTGVEDMVKVWGLRIVLIDDMSVTPCACCSRIEGDHNMREVNNQIRRLCAIESEYRENMPQVEQARNAAPQRFRDLALVGEHRYLDECQLMTISQLDEIQDKMADLQTQSMVISGQISHGQDNFKFSIAFGNLNARKQIYFGVPDEIEMRAEPDDYPLKRKKVDPEIYLFCIMTF